MLKLFIKIFPVQFFILYTNLIYANAPSANQIDECRQILISGDLSKIRMFSAVKFSKRNIWIAQLNTQIEIILLPAVYPPYFYGHDLLHQALQLLKGNERILILGVGSGYDAVVLKKSFPDLNVEAVDIDPQAVINTNLNLIFHTVSGARAYRSDLFTAVNGKYDLILFNAPRNIEFCLEEKSDFDETSRFDCGGELLQRFLTELPKYLTSDGSALIMTNADHEFEFKFEQLKTGSWDRAAPAHGSYAIFLLKLE